MTQIINAYANGNSAVADSLKSLGDSMFGNQARQSLIREQAGKLGRENTNAEPYAAALRDADAKNALYYGSMAGHLGQDLGAGNLASAAAAAGPNYRSPTLATMALGAGHSAEGTFPGLDATLAQRAASASEATNRAAQTQESISGRQIQQQQWQDEHTLVPVVAPDGVTTIQVPKNQVQTYQSRGYTHSAPTLDQVIANRVRTNMAVPQPAPVVPNTTSPTAQPPAAQPTSAPIDAAPVIPASLTAPDAPPQASTPQPAPAPSQGFSPQLQGQPSTPDMFAGIPREILHQKNLLIPPKSYTRVSDGQVIVSSEDPAVLAQQGFQETSAEGAQAQTRDNAMRDQAAAPLPPRPTVPIQAAEDAAKAAGLGSAVQHEWNKVYGAFTGGEVGAGTNRGRENLDNLAQNTRAIVANSPGSRTALKDRELVMKNMPQPGYFGVTGASADEERNSTYSFITGLRNLYASEQKEADDRNTPDEQVKKLTSHMRELRGAIVQWEQTAAPQAGAQGAPAAPKVSLPPRAQNVKVINGKTWYTIDGKVMKQ